MNKISDCEEKIMMIIWECDAEVDAKTVMLTVNARFGLEWAIQTVYTFLTRLEKKGFLVCRKKEKCNHYKSIVALKDYRRACVQDILKNLYAGDVKSLQKDLK